MSDPHAMSKSTGRNPGGYDSVRHADAAERESHDRKGDRIIEAAVERENMMTAWQRVKANKGAPGVDNMTVEALWPWLQANWPRVKVQLLEGTYQPAAAAPSASVTTMARIRLTRKSPRSFICISYLPPRALGRRSAACFTLSMIMYSSAFVAYVTH